ncbi:MAG: hypothetical protein J3Q66DRAFT_350847 [Benniella sp.]|nr:MAG: hypothetical protein J3Q66DRAFT_350847 [Benniella sp.]
MLEIQELDNMICQLLSVQDLARCARVNKRWHSIVIPHLWRDLECVGSCWKRSQEFVQMVAEDYLEEQQRRNLLGEGQSSHMSALSKYGHWIRLLPNEYFFKDAFIWYESKNGPSAFELFQHLFRRCSSEDAQVEYLSVSTRVLDLAPHDSQRAFYDFMLPRTRQLYIRGRLPTSCADMSKVANLLGQCSGILKRLDLNVDTLAGTSGIFKLEEAPTDIQPRAWASFKKLTLIDWVDGSFWTWFFKQCHQVETLEVRRPDGTAQALAQAMLNHMPQLTEIILECSESSQMKDDDVAALLLAGSTKGWRRVKLGSNTHPGKRVMDALEKHLPTLEALEFNGGCHGFWSENMLPFLRSCPQLQSFVNTDRFTTLDVKTFIDRDPVTDTLRPWDCERTLKVLQLAITGIPRNDWPGHSIERGSWSSQGYEIHNGLFDRLARLTHLEVLWLGSHSHGNDNESLELSLASGLYKLAGLKKLKELYINGLCAKIGIKEAQWMVENWPRLRMIDGLKVNGVHEEVIGWIRKNHARISVL